MVKFSQICRGENFFQLEKIDIMWLWGVGRVLRWIA